MIKSVVLLCSVRWVSPIKQVHLTAVSCGVVLQFLAQTGMLQIPDLNVTPDNIILLYPGYCRRCIPCALQCRDQCLPTNITVTSKQRNKAVEREESSKLDNTDNYKKTGVGFETPDRHFALE